MDDDYAHHNTRTTRDGKAAQGHDEANHKQMSSGQRTYRYILDRELLTELLHSFYFLVYSLNMPFTSQPTLG